MKKELREKIIAYNRAVQANAEKADDMGVVVAALAELPPGQIKKLLTPEVIAVIEKYVKIPEE